MPEDTCWLPTFLVIVYANNRHTKFDRVPSRPTTLQPKYVNAKIKTRPVCSLIITYDSYFFSVWNFNLKVGFDVSYNVTFEVQSDRKTHNFWFFYDFVQCLRVKVNKACHHNVHVTRWCRFGIAIEKLAFDVFNRKV